MDRLTDHIARIVEPIEIFRIGRRHVHGQRRAGAHATGPDDRGEAAGQVKVDGEIWDARAAAAVRAGDSVRVTAVDGLTLEVEKADLA